MREKLEGSKEAFVAQEYAYGDCFEYDFGEVHLVITGTMRKLSVNKGRRIVHADKGNPIVAANPKHAWASSA